MLKIITEGKAKIKVPVEEKVSRKLPVFYNPVMEFNRTVSILLLNAVEKEHLNIGSPLAGSGVREIRFILELKKSKIKSIALNDINPVAYNIIKENLKLNNLRFIEINSEEDYNKEEKIKISENDANKFLLNSSGFDYIDIDPFGSPNIFLDSAIKRLGRDGILAVTATDTSALSGSYKKACMRKYWAVPQRDDTMHENGLRILIRKVQLIGADHNKALTPIFSYSREHYFRVFFRCEKGKTRVDKIIRQHGMFNEAGPLWLGSLWDKNTAKNISSQSDDKFLKIIEKESKINTAGFYNLPKLCKKHRLIQIKQEELIKRIKSKGFKAAETHFAPNSIRSNIELKELIKLF